MGRFKLLAMAACLGLFYGLVIVRLDDRREQVETSGSAAHAARVQELRDQEQAVRGLEQKLAKREQVLGEKFGQLRYLPDGDIAPLDTLMECLMAAVRDAGGDIRQVRPIDAVDTGLMSQQGLEVQVRLPGEQAFETLINAMRTKYCPRSNEHSVTLTKVADGVMLEARFTVLDRKRQKGGSVSAAEAALRTWQEIEKPREKMDFDALLEPRPLPAPSVAPQAAPEPEETVAAPPPVESAPPPPPPPQFSGRLVGLTMVGGRAVTLVEVGGQQRVFEQGEEIDGCKLVAIFGDRMELDCGGRKTTVYFPGEDEPEPGKPAPASAPHAPSLGVRGRFLPVTPGQSPPEPYDHMSRVFLVTGVDPASPAGHAGLRAGDRVLAIDGALVHSPDQVRGLSARLAAGRGATMRVERNRGLLVIGIRP